MRLRLATPVAALVAATTLLTAGPSPASPLGKIRTGGTLRVSFVEFDHVDPALSYTVPSAAIVETACATPMRYPSRPGEAGFRPTPDAAARPPKVSRDRRTYTFTIRRGLRFSNGEPVRANAFARAINRTLAPSMKSPGAQYTRAIVGARDVLNGTRPAASGVVADGYRLTVRFTRPVPDFAAQTTMAFFCAVPPNLPVDPEGARAPIHSAGPYYVAEYVPGQRIVLRENRFYRGSRPHRVDRIEVDLRAASPEDVLDAIERGQADWGIVFPQLYFDPARRLVRKYGVNRSRFFVRPGLVLRAFALNTSRPLFRDRRLRRAVNFAVDRAAVRRVSGGRLVSTPTDQYLPPSLPGFRRAAVYPLARPNVPRARALARGRVRGRTAVLYTFNGPTQLAMAQIVKRDLARIGLEVEVRGLEVAAHFERISRAGEPWDIAFYPWAPDYFDPYTYLNLLLHGDFVGVTNPSRFDSPRYNALLRRVARLRGAARYRAYGALDVRLAREAAPMVAIDVLNVPTLVSRRVDRRCVVLRPYLDLAAACLK